MSELSPDDSGETDRAAAASAHSRGRSSAAQRTILYEFVLEMGRALSLAGTAVSETQDRLLQIAAANGVRDAQVVVLPTTLMVALGHARRATVEVIPQRTGALRLDQISALYEIVKRAEAGTVTPEDGLEQLRAVDAMRPRFGPVITIFGHTLMTVALCLLLKPTLPDVAAAAVFGVLVGVLALVSRGRHTLTVLIPIVAALVVSALTFLAIQHGVADLGLPVLIAPLVTFLPGAALTTATVELASGEMVAGSSRLVFGGLQLLLLAFGIVAGAEIAGPVGADALHSPDRHMLGSWAPWLGVLVFGLAAAVYFSAPRGATRWLLLVLFVAWGGQLAGDHLIGSSASGFCGALAMTPVALAVARLPSGPPSQVTFLPAFWMLVPGALGLISTTELLGNVSTLSPTALIQPVVSIVAIALGVLCGVSLYRAGATGATRIPEWQRAIVETSKRRPPPGG
ncbi:uncharacterized membrane protein YjjP [Jatrophihabitans sp. GAS493]|uniref:threonine/serine ThrE exporter family protein n=1 Tax=Jatrophihabitans sp. GAS493 TaxID=1907575 RepID=UPI000BB6C91E|nr:threonine/serine exporter family protein [Jatrophihabitans sp. GAS493]SOD74904.1 uncharacterized membrane protein YjjP [Jatrophihabitans sp. GAS493]